MTETMNKVIAVIFAGGSGVRMGAGKPKQFLEVNGKPIIMHTLEIFESHPQVDEIYVACKEDYIDKLEKLLRRFDIQKVKTIVPGGDTGMDSIFRGLTAAKENSSPDDIVLIHDGVRPIVPEEIINEVIATVKDKGAAATCTPMFETPITSKSGEFVEETPQRNECYTAQAPQGFILDEVYAAHDEVRKNNPKYEGIVDNCTLMKSLGREVAIVKGPRSNIKVTTTEDLYILRAMIAYHEDIDALGI